MEESSESPTPTMKFRVWGVHSIRQVILHIRYNFYQKRWFCVCGLQSCRYKRIEKLENSRDGTPTARTRTPSFPWLPVGWPASFHPFSVSALSFSLTKNQFSDSLRTPTGRTRLYPTLVLKDF